MDSIRTQLETIRDENDKEMEECGDGPEQYPPCLSEEEVAEIERRFNIRLPEEYRQFLLHIGGGIDTDNDARYYLESPSEKEKYFYQLNKPFLFKNSWERQYDDEGEPLEPDIDYQTSFQGAIILEAQGCGVFHLLVVSGEAYGQVWVHDMVNSVMVYPIEEDGVRCNFIRWYQMWTKGLLEDV